MGRRKGRPNRRWMDSANEELRKNVLSGEHTQNLDMRRQLVGHIDPI